MDWTPEIVDRLAKYVESDRYFRVELGGSQVGRIYPAHAPEWKGDPAAWDGFEFGSPRVCEESDGDKIRQLRTFQPSDFKIIPLHGVPEWWKSDPVFPKDA